ncbi:E3 ubiquitin protein ligase [Pleurostoma richardsiae]|uniref:E3 ubiquitin protein ligase n=1 Tax=Pleurostoma richardsiae TaxID=41990 RepID=A0AA38RGB1_9PEZI|nr:E3 ubiquitin protein ligase [Pleurostoma richardsiae]
MDDRKRPAVGTADDLAPPSKRQAVNGNSKSRDDGVDTKEEAWIEEFQKGAIYRQMQEYKREKNTVEARLEEISRRCEHYEDHLRVLDAWWLQLIQEVELLVEGTVISQSDSKDFPTSTELHFKDNQDLQRHLADKGKSIKSTLEPLFTRIATRRGEVKPDVAELESQVKALLANEKESIVKLDRLRKENESLSAQLDKATLRYIKAEKKLDRAKSAQVQKLEQQALATATARPAVIENGVDEHKTEVNNDALELQYKEAIAVVAKQREQLDSAFAEIKGLQEENSTFKGRRESLTDEDYSRTEVFKQFKSQNEDLIKRINHLEATNKQLREEAEKLQAERTSFRTQLEREAQAVTGELEDQIQQKEQDLTRIRSARDELLADVSIRKSSQEQERAAFEHMKELVSAKEDRISALESELGRLRPGEDATMSDPRPDLEGLSPDELREKYLKLEKDFESINKELPSIEKAYRKTMSLAQKKVMDFAALEERITVLLLEKGKADQKYFAARKDADIRNNEIKALRHQNGKSSEIIAQLKDAEAQARSLVSNLEKQLSDLKQANIAVMEENRNLRTANADALRRSESVKAQISDLTNLVKSKDATVAAVRERAAGQESEAERLKVRLENVQKERDSWKSKCLSNSSEEEEMLRNFALCSICRNNFKNTVLKTCGHVFCSTCIENRLTSRMRKCPTCSKAFDKMDVMAAHL